MINRPAQPKPKRDELAETVSFLNPLRMRRGVEAFKEFLRIEDLKNSTRADAFEGSAKFADPDETGIFRQASGKPVFELTDQDMRIRPGLASYFDLKKGGVTPNLPAGQTIQHDELFDRVPELEKVGTEFVMPEVPDKNAPGLSGKASYYSKGEKGPEGSAWMRSAHDQRDINASHDRSLRGLAAHEIGEHAVADYVGLPKGDNPNNDNMAAAFSTLVHPRAAQYKTALSDFKSGLGLSEEDWLQEYADADEMLKAASRLYMPARGSKKVSMLPWHDRYENVSGEAQGRKVANRLDMTTEERMMSPPWLPEAGENPYPLQMINRRGVYSMPDDRDVLRNLMRKR